MRVWNGSIVQVVPYRGELNDSLALLSGAPENSDP